MISGAMRNVFDQYEQPENKLTHALICTLESDRSLIHPFLEMLGILTIPPTQQIRIGVQRLPGEQEPNDGKPNSLPDACFYTDEGWAVVVESKVQAKTNHDQLKRHAENTRRHRGFDKVLCVLIAVDPPEKPHSDICVIQWCQIYEWFYQHKNHSQWAEQFVEYMEVFETKMTDEQYDIRGTITMFSGLRFDEKHPYNYHQAKRLIKLLGNELRKQKALLNLGVDFQSPGRGAITGSGGSSVWDYLPLRIANHATNFTDFPHFTYCLDREYSRAAITIPNAVKGGFRTKLACLGTEDFRAVIIEIEQNLRQIVHRTGAEPILYALQRHYASQRSHPKTDARLDVDIRTLTRSSKSKVKYQPQWIDAIYDVLIHKRSNIQLGMEVRFPYDCEEIGSKHAVKLFVETWKAISPLLRLAIDEN